MADAELPNLGLLIRLLKLTTSSNDAEALVAVRKANEQLAKFGGDWESLLRGKVTVIGDPFEGLSQRPPTHEFTVPVPPPPLHRSQQQTYQQQTYQQYPSPPPIPQQGSGIRGRTFTNLGPVPVKRRGKKIVLHISDIL